MRQCRAEAVKRQSATSCSPTEMQNKRESLNASIQMTPRMRKLFPPFATPVQSPAGDSDEVTAVNEEISSEVGDGDDGDDRDSDDDDDGVV